MMGNSNSIRQNSPFYYFLWLLAGSFVLFNVYSIVNELRTYSWQPVMAKIVTVDHRCCQSRGQAQTLYVEYEFTYQGQKRRSDWVSLAPINTRNDGQHIFVPNSDRDFRVGDTVSAYANDTESVLEAGLTTSTMIFTVVAVGLVIKIFLRNRDDQSQ
ncbi:MAG: hypothetical protein ACI8WB_000902 [Phenylobacterium sp.]|jgi:hypothetical protein